ncbi:MULTISPECIES: ABC transporter permease [unclassified Microbacterium]|uniref:ABC transporter permease n=1 Tax=unclassified Microbacterium TaxID=2609290 RepID=UPI001ACD8B93|nr:MULTISPECIES: ABC transporter permease [unclassified Microbacterium]MBN9155957.1 ABC transporter permease [Microbacterium sp.]MBS1899527.1 ABC transporter permease [Actinomycetota bacterium]
MTTIAPAKTPPRSSIPSPRRSAARRGSVYLSAHPRARLALLLSAPLFWLGAVYVVALALLLVTAFWTTDTYTGQIRTEFTFDNVVTVVTDAFYQGITLRTVGIALAVTLIDVALALPIAYFMAMVASPALQRALVVLVLTPLWASYLVKAFAWRSVLSSDGILDWLLRPFGGSTPGYGITATIITLSYLWLPYVILPIYAGLERVPSSLLEASGDLGGRSWATLRLVVWPMALPAIIAGTIFSFSLSLGDYITIGIVGGGAQMLGTLVYQDIGAANNLPLASAIALIPIVIIFGYLFLVRRTGALDNL